MRLDLVDTRLEPPAGDARSDVRTGARAALALLREASGFPCWAVSRVVGDDWTLVEVADDAYGLGPGYTARWNATLCRPMALGLGPRIAPDVAEVPEYAGAPLRARVPVGAYAGTPLRYEGALVGTLFGMDPAPRAAAPPELARLLDPLGAIVGALLGLDSVAAEVGRRAAQAEVEAHVDNLTQLGNRLAWSKVLVEQEARCRRYGRPASVVSVDLDGLKRANDAGGHAAGDRLLRRAAVVLRRASRTCDHVARVGGDEFAILAVETGADEAAMLVRRLQAALDEAGIEASVGMAARDAHGSLEAAWRAADVAMYGDKRRRLSDRVIRALVDPDAGGRSGAGVAELAGLPVVRRIALPVVLAGGRA